MAPAGIWKHDGENWDYHSEVVVLVALSWFFLPGLFQQSSPNRNVICGISLFFLPLFLDVTGIVSVQTTPILCFMPF